jgi:membrane-bound inhibitor of C-type lysozyme
MQMNYLNFLFILFALVGCSNNNSSGTNTPTNNPPNGTTLPTITGNNVMSLTVNGSNCAAGSYVNKPCVSVTICTTNNSNCQTINDILLDTGSYGLRLFKSVITVPITPITSGSNTLAECVQFGDGSSLWGTVDSANVILGNEPAVTVPIQVVDSTYGTRSSQCSNASTSPSDGGFNGILGVGFFPYDCGGSNNSCATNANNHFYYSCNNGTCSATTASLSNQVHNPVPFLPTDNNGLILSLPSVSTSGAAYANGYVILGVGTETNNQPSGVTAYTANSSDGDFKTNFNGSSYGAFIDSGSNAIYFDDSSLTDCSRYQMPDFYCPDAETSLSATTVGTNAAQSIIPFQVQNVETLLQGGGNVFSNITGKGDEIFDWGLPFFLGRNVYLGFDEKSSSLGSNTYWAY